LFLKPVKDPFGLTAPHLRNTPWRQTPLCRAGLPFAHPQGAFLHVSQIGIGVPCAVPSRRKGALSFYRPDRQDGFTSMYPRGTARRTPLPERGSDRRCGSETPGTTPPR